MRLSWSGIQSNGSLHRSIDTREDEAEDERTRVSRAPPGPFGVRKVHRSTAPPMFPLATFMQLQAIKLEWFTYPREI